MEKIKPNFGKTPLFVSIKGQAPCTGKTTIQFLMADFLANQGHKVFVSDSAVGNQVFKNNLKQFNFSGHPAKVLPLEIYLHVESDSSVARRCQSYVLI